MSSNLSLVQLVLALGLFSGCDQESAIDSGSPSYFAYDAAPTAAEGDYLVVMNDTPVTLHTMRHRLRPGVLQITPKAPVRSKFAIRGPGYTTPSI